MFDQLPAAKLDPLLDLMRLYREDTRTQKIDLGVGVYRTATGETPVMRAVKAAEKRLLEAQASKSYLGPEGDRVYVDLLQALLFGAKHPALTASRIAGCQTPGGTGALRLGAEVLAATKVARIWVGTPTWPNHIPIFAAAGVKAETYPFFDVKTQSIQFDAMLDALRKADAGDAVLLHGCCHNPTGADLSPAQWREVNDVVLARKLLPFVDFAYHGLGDGLDVDIEPARILAAEAPEALFAFSCSKNFGIYRDRTGMLSVLAKNDVKAKNSLGVAMNAARASYSMPPDHGAAVVRTILEDAALKAEWLAELDTMRDRLAFVRKSLVEAGRQKNIGLAAIEQQKGMFSTLNLTPQQVDKLRVEHGIYMAGSGRINVAGFKDQDIPAFIDALAQV